MQKTVLGIFTERTQAEDVINQLQSAGYNPKDISIVMKDQDEAQKLEEGTGADVASDTAKGATTGAIVGGIAGLVAAFAIPGLGAFLIGGPIAAALGLTGAAASTVSGAATGAVAGGILGALSNLGMSHDDAQVYERSINEGGILVAVSALSGEEGEVQEMFDAGGANQVKTLTPRETTEGEYTRNQPADYTAQPAYFSEVSRNQSNEEEDTNSNKGWEGESERHAEAAKKGHATESKSAGRGWHGESENHAEARKGKKTHKA